MPLFYCLFLQNLSLGHTIHLYSTNFYNKMLAKSIYKIESVKNIYSGDDLILMLDLGHDGLYRLTRCRLLGVDAPSAFNSKNTEAIKLKNFVSKVLSDSKESYVEVSSYRNNSWLVILYTKDPDTQAFISLNRVLINNGYIFNKEATTNAR